ncbi:hypothetical protein [Streptomyces sp. NPDC058545]|uniref:hypothetical protein n=1 Tax=Streptomyces sp. NPDC058545 TaxID=3346544 RepID=UPI003645FA1A
MEPAARTAESAAGDAALRQRTCDPGQFTLRQGAFIIRSLDGTLFTVSDTKGGRLIQRTQADCADQVCGRPQACALRPFFAELLSCARHVTDCGLRVIGAG